MNNKRLTYTLFCLIPLTLSCQTTMAAVDGIQAITKEEAQQQDITITEDVYVDNLIDPNVAEDPSLEELNTQYQRDKKDEPEGIRAYQIDIGYKNNNDGQSSQSLGLSTYRQTSDYGEFRVNANISQISPSDNTDGQNGIFNIQNTRLAISEKVYADTQVGIINGEQNTLLGRSRYQNLPTQTYKGINSRLYFDDTEIRLTRGTLGEISNESYFKSEETQVTGLGYAKIYNNKWLFASQAWQGESEENFLELAATLKYQKDTFQSSQLQIVANKQASGFSFNTEFPMQRTRNKFGAYYLNEGLTWLGKPINDDSHGVFFQSDYQTPRISINSGVDYQKNQVSDAEEIQQRLSLYQNYNFTYNKSTSLGGGVRYNGTSDTGLNNDKRVDYKTYFFINKRYASGLSHRGQIDLSKRESRVNNLDEDEKRSALGYSVNMLLPMSIDMGWQIEAEKVISKQQGEQEQLSTGLSLSRAFSNNKYLSTNIQYSNTSSKNNTNDQQWNANISYDLPINKSWHLGSYANYGLDYDSKQKDYGLGLKLTYNKQSGKPFVINGKGRGNKLGDIKGMVFLDENNDGIRQPSEKFANDIQIILDRGYTVTTNRLGEFEFPLVQAGVHNVSVGFDSIPLPWENNNPVMKVEVKLRETTRINIPLGLIPGQEIDQ